MNADCPHCDEDLEDWLNKHPEISPYGDTFQCPKCNKKVKCGYDESWDGKDEQQYFWLEMAE